MNTPLICEICHMNDVTHFLIVAQPAVPSQRCAVCDVCHATFYRQQSKYPGMVLRDVDAEAYASFTPPDFTRN